MCEKSSNAGDGAGFAGGAESSTTGSTTGLKGTSTYQDLRTQFRRLTDQRRYIDGKIALLSQLLSIFE